MVVFNTSSGYWRVVSVQSSIQATLNFLSVSAYPYNAPNVGNTVASGAEFSPTGIAGINAFTALAFNSSNITTPSASYGLSVVNSQWVSIGQNIILSNGTIHANFLVTAIPSTTSITATFLNYAGDSTGLYAIGSTVSPSGISQVIGALPSILTDTTGGTPSGSNTLLPGASESLVVFPIPSLVTGIGTGGITWMPAYTPGFNFEILQLDYISTLASTGAGATQTFQPQITGGGVTGGAVTITLANSNTTLGKLVSGTVITAANTGGTGDTISIVVNAGGTVFTAGSGYFIMRIRNLDSTNALSTIAATLNALITAL